MRGYTHPHSHPKCPSVRKPLRVQREEARSSEINVVRNGDNKNILAQRSYSLHLRRF